MPFLGEKFVRKELNTILHLPLIQRLMHHKARRPVVAVVSGVFIMLTGSSIAMSAEAIGHLVLIPHVLVDTLGYSIHGIGLIPLCKYAEPIWFLVMGIEEGAE